MVLCSLARSSVVLQRNAVQRAFCGSQQLSLVRAFSQDVPKVTAAMVKELRERTGSPMMECKKALSDPEVAGDMKLASEWLRKRGVAMAAKKMDRAMNDGLVAVVRDETNKFASLVEVSSETDFVARNDVFQGTVQKVAQAALDSKAATVDELLKIDSESESVSDRLIQLTATLGENIALKNVAQVAVDRGVIGSYIHNKRGDIAGTQVAVVALESENTLEGESLEKVQTFADRLAMHLVGAQAMFLDTVPQSVVDSERKIELERLMSEATANTEKQVDPQVLEKRVNKKVDKILRKKVEEEVLLNQNLVSMDPELSGKKVSKAIEMVAKASGTKLTVPCAVRLQVGLEEQAILKSAK